MTSADERKHRTSKCDWLWNFLLFTSSGRKLSRCIKGSGSCPANWLCHYRKRLELFCQGVWLSQLDAGCAAMPGVSDSPVIQVPDTTPFHCL